MNPGQRIAIVGISAALPSGNSAEKNLDHRSFFDFLLGGGESFEPIPETRFNARLWKGKGLGHISTQHGSFLKDIDLFDHVEFGVSSRDARAMAPATRALLEHSFGALLDSGIDYRKRRVGCFMSANSVDLSNVGAPDEYESRGSFARVAAMVANRVSLHLDLLGPSVPIDTACSSSQTAFHLAVQAVISGDCEAAVVGGCQLNHRFVDWIDYSQSGVLAPNGKCKPFNISADGFGRAEGCVVVVIKPLVDAVRDHDRIYATVLGTSTNNNGGGAPPAAPVAEYQADAMKAAFARAGRAPSEVSYVEVHATGTAKGDPTEANWVGEHFSRNRDAELLIGSVKGNIGHTEITAFLASLSKVLSIFEYGVIPPNVNVSETTLNPAIRWAEYQLRVPTRPTPLPSRGQGRALISMSSSGIGGSNGHVVLEAPPAPRIRRVDRISDRPLLLMAGGLSPRSAATVAEAISGMLTSAHSDAWPAAATVLGRRAKQMSWRSMTLAVRGSSTIQFSKPQSCARDVNPIVFVFSGQGPQHEAMGRELFNVFPVFRDSIVEMDAIFTRVTGQSIIRDHGLFGSASPSPAFPAVWPSALTLPSIAMFQMAFFDLLLHLGVKPDIVLGHSAGETALLYASGAAPKAMAIELAIIRGRIFSTLENAGGTMAALSCTLEEAEFLLEEYKTVDSAAIVEVACLNAPAAVAISGQETAIDAVLARAQSAGIFARKIRTFVPIHSSMMDSCSKQYLSDMQDLFDRYPGVHVPAIPTYSTLTGRRFAGPFDAEYYWMNTRSQVLFTHVIQNLGASATFVEIAPHPVLSSYISVMAAPSSTVLSAVFRPSAKSAKPASEYRDVLQFLGQLTLAGHNCVDFTVLNGALGSECTLHLPPYPFLKKRFPLFPDTATVDHFHGPLNRSRLRLNRETHPTFAEHVIRGEPIWPAAGFLEMALEFGATILFDVNLRSMLSLSSESPLSVNVSNDGAYWKVTSAPVRLGQNSKHERLHADGYMLFEAPPTREKLDIAAIRGRCNRHVDADLYPSLSYFSKYGPKFQRITNLYYNLDEALASIRGIDRSLNEERSYIAHPAIVDALGQIAAYRPFNGDFAPNSYYLPSRILEMILHYPSTESYFSAHLYAYVKVRGWTPESMTYEGVISDDSGKALCTLEFELARHQMAPLPPLSSPIQTSLQCVFHAARSASRISDNAHQLEALTTEHDVASVVCALRLGDAISSMVTNAHTGRHVVRICVFSDVPSFIYHLTAILLEYPTVAFELFLPSDAPLPEDIAHPYTVLRTFDGSPTKCDGFDAVVSSGWTYSSAEFDLSTILRDYHDLLLPGGTLLIVTSQGSSNTHLFSRSDCESVLSRLGYSFLASDSSSLGASLLVLDCQKSSHMHELGTESSLYNERFDFTFDYALGDETQLQWYFTGLNPSQALQIWILAAEGPDAAAGMGVARCLRKEYPYWEIRFVSFPNAFSQEARIRHLAGLPLLLKTEPDIVFSSTGEPLVPRLAPLRSAAMPLTPKSPPNDLDLGLNEALVTIQRSIQFAQFCATFASVVHAHPEALGYPAHSLLVGLQRHTTVGQGVVDLESMCAVPVGTFFSQSQLDQVPGLLTAVLALPTLNGRNRKLAILVTHSNSDIGRIVCDVCSQKGLTFFHTTDTATLLDLSRMGRQTFDLIISGHDNKTYTQVLNTLLKPSVGRLFLWHNELLRILVREPSAIGDALAVAFSRNYYEQTPLATGIPPGNPSSSVPTHSIVEPHGNRNHTGAKFSADKTYILLGGIGNIGAHIALFMVERGARHLVVTSRSGEKSLLREDGLIIRRIFKYLQSLDYLEIRLVATDATSAESMRELFGSIPNQVGGCVLLAAVQRDGLFLTLSDADFTSVFDAKIGAVDVLQKATDISTMDFVVAFSSVTSIVGTGGQTNYCASNSALEEKISRLSNGFSFICPAIIDSSVMHAGGSRPSRLNHLVEWAMSEQELMLWFDDALSRFQGGARFPRYMPALNWEALNRTHGMPKLGEHLVPSSRDAQDSPSESQPISVKVGRIIREVLNVSTDDFDGDVPLTSYGIDSLSAGRLSFALRGLVQVTQLQLLADNSAADIIQKFPLAADVVSSTTRTAVAVAPAAAHHTVMEASVRMFSELLDALNASPIQDAPVPPLNTVLLTGTTGALGCHLLAHLLNRADVRRVYALNRGGPGDATLVQRQAAALSRQGLSQTLVTSPKLMLVTADLTVEDLGISAGRMSELLSSVTQVIHNAWRIDFMARFSEFESLITGTYHLLKFAMKSTCPGRASFSFISTIGVSRNLPSTVACAAEQPIEDARIAVQTGYTESKWVGERLVQLASKKRYLNANVIRVGQLTGGTSGRWDTSQWFPALAQSGPHVGCLPDGDDIISWLSIDAATFAIVDLQGAMNDTFHVVHPRPTTWRAVMQPLGDLLGVPLVPYAEWFARLKATADFADGSVEAIKLLDFFQQGLKPAPARESMGLLPHVAADKAVMVSNILMSNGLQSLGTEDVEKWVRYWGQIGFLPGTKADQY